MPTIDDFHIPDFICQYFNELIESASNSDIQAIAKTNTDLMRGIRPTKANTRIIRQRLRTILNGTGPLDPSLCYILGKLGFNLEFIAVLSTQVLKFYVHELAAVYGSAKTLGAMLVDERQPVRQIAIDFLTSHESNSGGLDLPEGPALRNLRSELEPFLTHIKYLLPENIVISKPDSDCHENDTSTKTRQINKLKTKLNQNIKSKQKIEKILNNKIEKKDTQLASLKERLNREKSLRQELDEEAKSLRDKLAKMAGQEKQKIALETERRISSSIRSWLVEPHKIATAVQGLAKDNNQDIQQRAVNILRAQEKIDRNYGNRRKLRQHLLTLEDLQGQVKQASIESLNPLPELTALSNELEVEIGRVKKILGEPPPGKWCLELESKINQAATQADFNAINKLLEQLAAMDLMNNESTRLHKLYHDALARLYEKYSPRRPATGATANFVQLTQDWYQTKGPFVLVVDGYNVILSLYEIFGLDYEADGKPGVAARRHLLQIIDKLLQNSKCLAEVFFDAEVSAQENFSSRVRVIFSGGGNREMADRADVAIIDYLSSLPKAQNVAQIIITDDRELQSLARQQQAKIMPLAQFAALIR